MRVVLAAVSIATLVRHCNSGGPGTGDSSDTGVVVCDPTECGPALGMPNTLCEDGITWAGPGDCILHADGACGWEVVECPEEPVCAPVDCGPAPGMPNYVCPDGETVAGPGACVPTPNGGCGYELVACPDVP